ncbi:uncharacterized protein [Primulina eburnea]|uniref:uncharacterized protein n=1 Tax=Primulina eburnea TaxID=1245227 RepID=UPI003C6BFE39
MMMMEEYENILDYDRRLWEIANEAFSLGESISNERLVSKVLRSLPERFNIKICAIDEAKDTSQMALEDPISSLRTFKMNMDMQKKDNGKTIAFQVSNDSYDDLLQISKEVNESDGEDSIAYITKKFGDYLKRIRDKIAGQPSKFPSLPAPERQQKFSAKQQFQPRNEGKGQFNSKKYDSLRCRECKGFGYNVSLSGEESDVEEKSTDEENHTSLTVLLTEKCWLQENIDLRAVVVKLEVIRSKKDLELGKTKDELQKAAEILSKFNSSTSKLDSILLMGRDDKKKLRLQRHGSSRHMTGSREYLFDYVEKKCGRVTYGGRAKGKIVGKGTLNVKRLSQLHNVQGPQTIATK